MKTVTLFLLCFIFLINFTGFSLIRINEIMSSNGVTISDEDGDYSDWIEIYNDGNTAVNLDGYTLSDSYEEPQRWRFPAVYIEPQQYLIVWASGKDRLNNDSLLHTDFCIKAEGEEILLSDQSGRIIDEFVPMSIPRDYSAGRVDEIDGWVILQTPTPGERNNSESYFQRILSSPRFSVAPGFFAEDTIRVELMHDDTSVNMYYTLDGSRPDTSSLMYTAPLILTGKTQDSSAISFIKTTPDHLDSEAQMCWIAPAESLEMGHVVRAVAWKENHVQSHTVSGSWFVDNAARKYSDCTVMSIIADPDDLFDNDSGIYVPGAIYDRRGYGLGPWGIPNANYHQRGDSWERDAHFEFFGSSAQNSIAHGDVGIRIFGTGSRVLPQKSLRLFHRKSLVRGDATGLDAEFFGESSGGQYDRLLLRNSGQDWYTPGTMLLDGFLQLLVRTCNVESQAFQPAVVFLNGEYWGIHNIRESIDQHYFARNFDIDADRIDIIDYKNDAVEGTADSYLTVLDYIDEHDIRDSVHYSFIQRH
ncbi:MAG: CotH kinase family protein, partial [Fibrobacterota bacterium]